jgi:hypothetical protein
MVMLPLRLFFTFIQMAMPCAFNLSLLHVANLNAFEKSYIKESTQFFLRRDTL